MSDPYPPPPTPAGDAPPTAPATGAWAPMLTELAPDEEPVTTGTFFLTIVILMIIAAFWVIIYLRLIGR